MTLSKLAKADSVRSIHTIGYVLSDALWVTAQESAGEPRVDLDGIVQRGANVKLGTSPPPLR